MHASRLHVRNRQRRSQDGDAGANTGDSKDSDRLSGGWCHWRPWQRSGQGEEIVMRAKTPGLLFLGPLLFYAAGTAQAPVAVHFTATSENVSGAGEAIRINLTGWSTDAQREELVS